MCQAGFKVLNLDNETYAANSNTKKVLSKLANYHFIKCSVEDIEKYRERLIDFAPDYIIHFAAESHVDKSIEDYSPFLKSNVLGTVEILNFSYQYYKTLENSKKARFKFLHVSTDEVFGSLGRDGSFDESSCYAPNSPYSASKAASDHFVRAWMKTFKFPAIITNCSNNFGPYQNVEKFIPKVITNAILGQKIPIYGSGNNVRDWLFVEDHCNALDQLLQSKRSDQYVIGGGTEITNLELVNLILERLCTLNILPSVRKDLVTFVGDRLGHDFRYSIDARKIFNHIGWKAKSNFIEALDTTIVWYSRNRNWWIDC